MTDFSQKQNKKKDNLQQQKKKIESDIASTNKMLEETRKSKTANLNQLTLLQGQIENQQKLLGLIQEEVGVMNREMALMARQIVDLENELTRLKDEYARMIYFSYLTRNTYHRLMFVFASSSMNEAFIRLRYLQEYSSSRRRQAELITEKRNMLVDTKNQLEAIKNEKFHLLKQQESEVDILHSQKKEKDKKVQDLKAKEKELLADIRKKQKEAEKLQRQIEELIRAEMEEANKKTNTTKKTPTSMPMTNEELEISKGFSGNKGKLPWPVDNGVVTGKFGEHPHPVLPGVKIKNNGIDVSTRQNSSVKAVFEGSVSAIITLPTGNKAVMIRHGEYLTIYSNLKSVSVSKGQKVKINDLIGVVYTDPEDNSSVFHFEVWREKTLENPEYWLKAR